MPTPAYARTWTQNLTLGRPGTRIPYVSLLDTTQQYLFSLTNFLGSNGLTIQFSSNSIIAGAGNNIAASTNWVRAASTTSAQSWMILLDGNGGQFLVSFTGSNDQIAYMGYSPGALFTGTSSTNRPTAADQLDITSSASTSLVGSGVTDRIWHCVVSSDAKAFRWCVVSVSAYLSVGGVDAFTPISTPSYISLHPVVVWGASTVIASITNWTAIGRSYLYASAVGANGVVGFNVQGNQQSGAVGRPLVQGSIGWQFYPVILSSNTAVTTNSGQTGTLGFLGAGIDLYLAQPNGYDTFSSFGPDYGWWFIGTLLWPNPSNQPPLVF